MTFNLKFSSVFCPIIKLENDAAQNKTKFLKTVMLFVLVLINNNNQIEYGR